MHRFKFLHKLFIILSKISKMDNFGNLESDINNLKKNNRAHNKNSNNDKIQKTTENDSISNQNNKNKESLPIVSKKYFIIDNKYACFKNFVIGSGSFGKVLYGMSVDRKDEYAIKFEKSSVKNSVLLEELKIYFDLKGGEGIPQIYWEGEYKNYKIFLMDLLGPSLDKFFKIENKLSLETSIFFGEQMIRRLEYLHSKNYIHRDIKPNNFLLGRYNRKFNDNKVYIIDFGLSKEYVDKKTKKHYEYNECSKFVGTPRYASVNTHVGVRQSRRDDLESVAYILIYFLNGELPWQGIKAKTKSEKKEKIKISKKNFDIVNQCEHYKNIPGELIEILEYTKNLKFFEKPNYDYIVMLLNNIRQNYFPLSKDFNENYLMFEWNEKFLNMKKQMDKSEKNSVDAGEIANENIQKFNKSNIDYTQMEKLFIKLYEGYPIQDFNEFLGCLENIENDNYNYYQNYNAAKGFNSSEQINFLENKRNEENKNNYYFTNEENMVDGLDNTIYNQNYFNNKNENYSDKMQIRDLQLSGQKGTGFNPNMNSSSAKKIYGVNGFSLKSNIDLVKDFNNISNKSKK